MKTLNKFTAIIVFALALGSCEKDEERAVVQPINGSLVSSTASTVVLQESSKDDEAAKFTWSPSDFGYSAAVRYSIQFDKVGKNFSNPASVAVQSNTSKTLTVEELNSVANQLNLAADIAREVEVRIKAEVDSKVDPIYSNVLKMTVTPYFAIIDYPAVYMPGSYQGWPPATADKLAEMKGDKKYEGYIYFNEASTMFKFTPARNWDKSYGMTSGTSSGNTTSGVLNQSGGGDFAVATGPGFYLVKIDLNANSWSATKTTWSVSGNAISGGEEALAFNQADKTWTGTFNLSAGQFKFRANGGSDIEYGDNEEPNGRLMFKGQDIVVSEPGQYQVVLDLSIAGNYRYSLTKI